MPNDSLPINPARLALRIGLVFLAAIGGVIGAFQLLLPRAFYDDFPIGDHPWVSLLPPYNEHLLRDVGAQTLATVVLLVVAAVSMHRLMVRTALVSSLVAAAPHFVFHLMHLEHFGTGDAIGQTAVLGLAVLTPAVLLIVSGRATMTSSGYEPSNVNPRSVRP